MPLGDITLEQVNPLQHPDWDAQIAELPGATFFHGRAWLSVLCDTYGFVPCYLVARAGAALQGVLPLMEVESFLTARRGVSLPFTDRCDALGSPAIVAELFREALALARARSWKYCEFRGTPRLEGATASLSYFTHTLDLAPGVAALWERVDSAVRRAIRKAEKSDVAIEFARSADAVATFHTLLCLTRKRHGAPPQPRAFFEQIQRHVLQQGQGWVALARHQGKPIAGAVFFQFGRNGLFKFGASDDRFQHLRANNLLMWRAIERHAAEGCRNLDFGRTSLTNDGLRRFKLGWGTQEQTLDYVRYECATARFVADSDLTNGWQTRLFKILPGPVSRLLGSAAYKHVA